MIYYFKKLTILLLCVLASAVQAQNPWFSIVNGIPHLPVMASVAAAGTGVPGALMYSTAEAGIYIWVDGTNQWVSICTQLPAGTGGMSYFTVSGGVPMLPTLSSTSVTSTTGQSGTMYYTTDSKGVMINNGSKWSLISTVSSPALSPYAQAGNLTGLAGGFAPPVLASDPAFVSTDKGAFYLNSADFKLHVNTGFAWDTVTCSPCPTSLTVNHTVTTASPVAGTITYGVAYDPTSGAPTCWLDRNLGATTLPTSATDASYSNSGWLYRYGTLNGYSWVSGTSYLPNDFADPYTLTTVWSSANDPCTQLIGTGWRIAKVSDYNQLTNLASTMPTKGTWGIVAWNGPLHLGQTHVRYSSASPKNSILVSSRFTVYAADLAAIQGNFYSCDLSTCISGPVNKLSARQTNIDPSATTLWPAINAPSNYDYTCPCNTGLKNYINDMNAEPVRCVKPLY